MYLKPFKLKKFIRKKNELTELCPWGIFADEGIVLVKNGALGASFEFLPPDLGSSSAIKIHNICQRFNNAIMQLGENWAVQFELRRTLNNNYPTSQWDTQTGSIIAKIRERNFSYLKAHFENHYYITFTYSLPPEITQKTSNLFLKRERDVSENNKSYEHYLNLSLIDTEIKNFKLTIEKLYGILGNYVLIKKLNTNELFTYFHSCISTRQGKRIFPKENIFIDSMLTDDDFENSFPPKLGNFYIPLVRVNALPNATIPAMFDAINGAQCELRWSTRFICNSKENASKKIKKIGLSYWRQRKSTVQWATEALMKIETSHLDSGALQQDSEASQAKAVSDTGEQGFGDYTSLVQIWDTDLSIAKEKAAYIQSIIESLGFNTKQETLNAKQAFCSMMPNNVFANKKKLFISTGNCSHIIPVSAIWSGLRVNNFMGTISGNSKPHLVCSTSSGIPFFLNNNVGDLGHQLVTGPTGAGKSTYLCLEEVAWTQYPNWRVIIFDKDKSARNLTMCIGGVYIEPGKDKISFQPLRDIDSYDDQRWAAEFIEILLSEQKIQITAGIRKAIFDAIKRLAESKKSDRTLTAFCQYCDYQNPTTKINEIVEGCAPYVLGGQFGELFDSDSTNLPIKRWTMFEMGTLMSMTQGAVAPALSFLFRQCEKWFDGSPVLLVLDEAWVYLKNPTFAEKILEWLKTLRKKHVFCLFATQELNDAISSPIATTIISQCASKVFLADDEALTPLNYEAYKQFGLTNAEINVIANSTKKLDYFYKSSLGTRKFQLDLDNEQLAIITNPKNQKILDLLEEKYGKNSGIELVKEILKEKGFDLNFIEELNNIA